MDALTPRSRQTAAAGTSQGDQETPRARDDAAPGAVRKESFLAAAAARASPRAGASAPDAAAGPGHLNLKQLVAAARAAGPGARSGTSTPRGGGAAAAAAVAAEAGGPAALGSPRGADQTPRPVAPAADEATVPAPAAAALEPAGGLPEAEGGDEALATVRASVRARATPALDPHADEPAAEPPGAAPAVGPQQQAPAQPPQPAAADAGLPLGRVSVGGAAAAAARRLTGPGGLTAAEILLMDARRPSRADSTDDLDLHWGQPGYGHASHLAPAVESISEEAAAAAAAAAGPATGPGGDALPVRRGLRDRRPRGAGRHDEHAATLCAGCARSPFRTSLAQILRLHARPLCRAVHRCGGRCRRSAAHGGRTRVGAPEAAQARRPAGHHRGARGGPGCDDGVHLHAVSAGRARSL
jgi:hypothetical protein